MLESRTYRHTQFSRDLFSDRDNDTWLVSYVRILGLESWRSSLRHRAFPATRCAAEHTLPTRGRDARISTTFLVQKTHLQLAGGGGFSVSRILIGTSKCERGLIQVRRSGPIGALYQGTLQNLNVSNASIPWIPYDCTLKFAPPALVIRRACYLASE